MSENLFSEHGDSLIRSGIFLTRTELLMLYRSLSDNRVTHVYNEDFGIEMDSRLTQHVTGFGPAVAQQLVKKERSLLCPGWTLLFLIVKHWNGLSYNSGGKRIENIKGKSVTWKRRIWSSSSHYSNPDATSIWQIRAALCVVCLGCVENPTSAQGLPSPTSFPPAITPISYCSGRRKVECLKRLFYGHYGNWPCGVELLWGQSVWMKWSK